MNAGRGKDALAIGCQAIGEHHAAEDGEVVNSGKQTCVACDAAHLTRTRIVNYAAQDMSRAGAGLRPRGQINFFRGRDSRFPFFWGQETRLAHTQRRIDFVCEEFVEGKATYASDNFTEEDESGIAVNETSARRRGERLGINFFK